MKWISRLVLVLLATACIPACSGQNNPSGTGITFSGLQAPSGGATPGAGGSQMATLFWGPAVESNGGGFTYLIFETQLGSGQENLSSPTFSTTALTMPVTVATGVHYWFIVQAQDAIGNVDGNTNEIEVIGP
ncbi:MAG TPA: hypothetical protein VKW04_02250 [Planctomycetota bacterium]|nr:hypothetical protein [Planctomycetota bacterium]